jgi:hypothetical protein
VNVRITIIAYAVGVLVPGVTLWRLGSSPEAAPAPAPKIAGPAGLSEEERQQRTDALAEMQGELMTTAAERGQSLP